MTPMTYQIIGITGFLTHLYWRIIEVGMKSSNSSIPVNLPGAEPGNMNGGPGSRHSDIPTSEAGPG
jgi:hypothetical protein